MMSACSTVKIRLGLDALSAWVRCQIRTEPCALTGYMITHQPAVTKAGAPNQGHMSNPTFLN